jgi:hypothetical protein
MGGTRARDAHWDETFRRAGPSGVGWFQPEPIVSLELIDELGLGWDAPIIDIGGGTSSLVDALMARGFNDLSVLDVSRVALDLTRDRLGGRAADVGWIHTDVLDFQPARRGPERCSGLPVERYGPDELAAAMGASRLVASRRQDHVTPGAVVQPFTWVVVAYGDTVGT